MKHLSIFLSLLLLALILYNIIGFREGLDGCPAGQTNSAEQTQKRCNTVNALANKELLDKVKKKITETQNLFDKVSKKVQQNVKNANINYKNSKKIQNAASGKSVNTAEACKDPKYIDLAPC